MKKIFMKTAICIMVLLAAGVFMTSCGRSNVMESDEDITAYVSDTFDDQISEYGDGADVKITDEEGRVQACGSQLRQKTHRRDTDEEER